jgi:hypothetical protein
LIRDLTHAEKVEAIAIAVEVSLDTPACSEWISPLVMDPRAFAQLLERETRLALDIRREGVGL